MKVIHINNSLREAIVDDEDFDKVNQYSWSRNPKGALQTTINYEVLNMPNIIFNNRKMYDHENLDSFDNRKLNLRIATNSQNGANRAKFKGNFSSQYKGVTYRKKRYKWEAYIMVNGKTISLGCHETELQAARAYNKAAENYFGEFARINIISIDQSKG